MRIHSNYALLLLSLQLATVIRIVTALTTTNQAVNPNKDPLVGARTYFKQFGITIDKLFSHPEKILSAHGTYMKKDVYITCPNRVTTAVKANRLYNIYADIIQGGQQLEGLLADGKEHIRLPLLMISKSNVRCYVVPSRCDKNLVTYARDMSAAIKEATLPGLLEQIIRGVAYLHRAGRTHGNINPSDICVNSNKLRKSTISIVISATSESLHYSIINSSKRQSRPRALTDEIAMLKKDTYGIGTSIYRVVSASSVYWTPNAQKLPDEFYHNNGLSRIPARIAIPFAKAILRPLISRMKELMEPNIEKRPTPQQYLKRFSYTPPLSMTST